jgi:hypothetical protein
MVPIWSFFKQILGEDASLLTACVQKSIMRHTALYYRHIPACRAPVGRLVGVYPGLEKGRSFAYRQTTEGARRGLRFRH